MIYYVPLAIGLRWAGRGKLWTTPALRKKYPEIILPRDFLPKIAMK